MAFVAIEYFSTTTTSQTSPTATAITLPAAKIALLLAQLGVSGNFTTVSVSDGINFELMNITGVSGGAANITRAQGGTTATTLAKGATVRFVWTTTSIQAVAPGGAVTVTGSGAADVTGGPAYNVDVPVVTIASGDAIDVQGSFPDFTIVNTAPAQAAVVVTADGIAVASGGPVTYNVNVAEPNFTTVGGLTITGVWPNLEFTNTLTQGGTGTIIAIDAGDGIAVTGDDPTIQPTISLATVGPGAGTYGGVELNDFGQVVSISSGIVTSISGSTSGLTVANPSLGVYTVDADSAGHSQQGLVALAPATANGSNDSGNDTEAVTPAGVAAVVAALAITPATLSVAGSQTALATGLYTTTIVGFNIPISVADGKNAIVDIYVETYDPANLTTPQSFAFGLYNSATLLAGNTIMIGCVRNLKYLVTGPLSTTLTVKTTALTGTQVVANYYASVVAN